MALLNNRSGKMTITGVLLLVAVVVGGYLAYAFGGVYVRRYLVTERIDSQLNLAGQLADETIRNQIVEKIDEMKLPPEASRVRMTRPSGRTIQVTVSYTETVNLFYTTKTIPIKVTRRRSW